MKDHSRNDHYFVNWYEADVNGQAKVSTICNYLQESAWRHAKDHGFGYEDALALNQAWVVVAQRLEMDRHPRWGETVQVETWPRDVKGFFAFRDYRIFTSNNELLGAASSSWMVIDRKTRRPCRLDILESSIHIAKGKKALEKEPELLRFNGQMEEIAQHEVEYTEIDFHGHVNNTRYVDWCMNALSMSHHRKFEVSVMTVNYLLEVRDKEKISILANAGQSPVTYLEGIRNTDGKSVLRMELAWRKR